MMLESPYTQPEIMDALREVENQVADYFSALRDGDLVSHVGDAWSPAEHFAHLNLAVSAVGRGFAVPRWLLRLRFGAARSRSRDYEQIRETYRARLQEGAKASGAFVPQREQPTAEQVAKRRAALLARWQRVNARLRDGLLGWSEGDLDRIRLPHPILGKLTAREMLFFTLYHNQHHVAAAKRRLNGEATRL